MSINEFLLPNNQNHNSCILQYLNRLLEVQLLYPEALQYYIHKFDLLGILLGIQVN